MEWRCHYHFYYKPLSYRCWNRYWKKRCQDTRYPWKIAGSQNWAENRNLFDMSSMSLKFQKSIGRKKGVLSKVLFFVGIQHLN